MARIAHVANRFVSGGLSKAKRAALLSGRDKAIAEAT
jgi:hypothetical protein